MEDGGNIKMLPCVLKWYSTIVYILLVRLLSKNISHMAEVKVLRGRTNTRHVFEILLMEKGLLSLTETGDRGKYRI